jgi:pimeloyl-ACP methyl ester carboxylesterase
MPTNRVAGVDVTYRLTGEGQTAVFITQGLGFASAEWWPIQDALSKRARVLTWDRPGYGSSGSPTSPRSVRNIAAEALELLSDVAPDGPLVLVGHSQGVFTQMRSHAWLESEFVALRSAHPDNGRMRRELPTQLFRRSRSDLAIGLRMGRRLARLHVIGAFKPVMMNGPPFIYCSQYPPDVVVRRMVNST